MQIVGDLNVARDALVQIASKLRRNFFQERDTGAGGGSYQSSLSALGLGGPIPSGYGVGHDPGSPGGMYSSMSGLGLQGGRLSSGYGSLGSPPGSWGVQVIPNPGTDWLPHCASTILSSLATLVVLVFNV